MLKNNTLVQEDCTEDATSEIFESNPQNSSGGTFVVLSVNTLVEHAAHTILTACLSSTCAVCVSPASKLNPNHAKDRSQIAKRKTTRVHMYNPHI